MKQLTWPESSTLEPNVYKYVLRYTLLVVHARNEWMNNNISTQKAISVPLRARFSNIDQARTKFKFDLDLGLAVIFAAPMQFRSNHELNSV